MATNAELGMIPGVRVREISNPDLSIASPQFRIAGLVSTSLTSLLKRDITVVRGSGETDTIPGYTAGEITKVECISNYQEAYGTKRTQYKADTDYTVEDNVITWTGETKPEEGDVYYVTATINKISDSFFEPKEFTDISQVKDEYGPEYDSTTKTINNMVALARFILASGAKRLVCVQSKSNSLSDYTEAIKKLEEQEVQYVLTDGGNVDGVNAALENNVIDMNTIEKSMPRLGFVAPKDLEPTVETLISEASAIKNQNIAMVAPGKVLINVEDELGNQYEVWVSSIYAVAVIVGMLCNPNRRLATPLTRKDLTSYGIIDTFVHYGKQDIQKLAAKGITVLTLKKSTNTIVINQGLTTDPTNFGTYYLNVECCKKEQSRLLKEDLESWIGSEILDDTISLLTNYVSNTLDSFKGLYFNAYKDLKVARDASIPTKINISYKIAPIFGLDYIDIVFSVYIG